MPETIFIRKNRRKEQEDFVRDFAELRFGNRAQMMVLGALRFSNEMRAIILDTLHLNNETRARILDALHSDKL